MPYGAVFAFDDGGNSRPDLVPVGRFPGFDYVFVIHRQGLKLFQHGFALPLASTHCDVSAIKKTGILTEAKLVAR